ncbi:MAG: thiosulfate oxidation carrier protein SoxY [Rhodocyclaceae bacterium]
MDRSRRIFIEHTGAAGAVLAAVAAGLLSPAAALAAEWNKAAFGATDLATALRQIGALSVAESADIGLRAPDVAENGAVVPVEVTSRIPGSRAIVVVGEKNAFPLIARFEIPEGTDAFVSMRIKMAQTSAVRAIVEANGRLYTAAKEVKVTIGGCGG